MIEGVVNADREPVIGLSAVSAGDLSKDLVAVIDTGFNGFLTLPPELIESLGYEYVGETDYTLADDTEVTLSYFLGTIWWDGEVLAIHILESAGQPLVGMALMEGYRLTIDVVEGGLVSVNKRP